VKAKGALVVKDSVPRAPKGVARDCDPELDWECEQAYFERLAAKLARGARTRGVTLTRAESAVLLERFLAPPAPSKRTRGRPVNDPNRVTYMGAQLCSPGE
jgi:hypothetical protein